MGLGQLTNRGKRDHLELGRFLRRRYDGFLPALYHRDHIRVESTDKDRTLMSAQANLAGLLPPRGSDVWDVDLPWQPIPVHTVPGELDLKLRPHIACAAWIDRWSSQPDPPEMSATNSALYAYLSRHSGVNVTSVENVSDLFETLEIEAKSGLNIPAWALAVPPGYTSPVYPDLLRPLSELHWAQLGASSPRLGGGPLLRDMVTNMREKVEDCLQPRGRRMFVYSGHDSNIVFLLSALKVGG